MSTESWEHFSHVADMGVRGTGPTLETAFEQAAMGLCALATELGAVRAGEEVRVRCEAPDHELLLVDWLNAIVFEMATRHMVFCRFSVEIDDHRLTGSAWGERIDLDRHPPGVEVKGATFTGLKVRKGEDGNWAAECVVDV